VAGTTEQSNVVYLEKEVLTSKHCGDPRHVTPESHRGQLTCCTDHHRPTTKVNPLYGIMFIHPSGRHPLNASKGLINTDYY
jgi:hypothetical protein